MGPASLLLTASIELTPRASTHAVSRNWSVHLSQEAVLLGPSVVIKLCKCLVWPQIISTLDGATVLSKGCSEKQHMHTGSPLPFLVQRCQYTVMN